jgi:RNA-splicing ligase RtcB
MSEAQVPDRHELNEKYSNEEIARLLHEQGDVVRERTAALDRGLLNEDAPLSDENVTALAEAVDVLDALTFVLFQRTDQADVEADR